MSARSLSSFARRYFFHLFHNFLVHSLYFMVLCIHSYLSFSIMLIISFSLICLFVFVFSRFGMCLVQKVRNLTAKTAATIIKTPAPAQVGLAAGTIAVAKSTKLMKWTVNILLCWIQQHLICIYRNWRTSSQNIRRIHWTVNQISAPNQNKSNKLNTIIIICQLALSRKANISSSNANASELFTNLWRAYLMNGNYKNSPCINNRSPSILRWVNLLETVCIWMCICVCVLYVLHS